MVGTKVANAIPLTPKSNFLELLETELSADGLRHLITKRISFEIPADMISLLLQRPRQFKNPSMLGTNFTQTRECQERAQAILCQDPPPCTQTILKSHTIIDITDDSPSSKDKATGDKDHEIQVCVAETMDPDLEGSSAALPSTSPSPSKLKASRILHPKVLCPPEPTPVSAPVKGCPACNRKKARAFEWQCCRMVSCGSCSSIRGVRTPNSKSKVYNPPERCPHCDRANPEIVQTTETSLIPTVLRELDGLSSKRVTSSHIIDIQEPSVEHVPPTSNMSKKKRRRETKNQLQGPKPKKMRTESNSERQGCKDSNALPPGGHWNNVRTQTRPVQSEYRDEDS
ncbi:MAG: hypothetical protein Q9187_006903, partial [Circinaria calcarea]